MEIVVDYRPTKDAVAVIKLYECPKGHLNPYPTKTSLDCDVCVLWGEQIIGSEQALQEERDHPW